MADGDHKNHAVFRADTAGRPPLAAVEYCRDSQDRLTKVVKGGTTQ